MKQFEIKHSTAAACFYFCDPNNADWPMATSYYDRDSEEDKNLKYGEIFAYARGYCDGIDASRKILQGYSFRGQVIELD